MTPPRPLQVACRKVWTKENVDEFRDFAGAKYRANMRLDNLPGAELVVFRDQNGAVSHSAVPRKRLWLRWRKKSLPSFVPRIGHFGR